MQRPITRGAAANAGLIFHIFAQDSTATDGAGKASVAFGSWSCRYIRNGETISGAITPQDITTIGTYEAPTANTNIRIKAVDNTNMIGVYEVHIHLDWVNTTNTCQSLTIYLTASGVAVLPVQIPLRGGDIQAVVAPVNLTQILGTALTETAGQIAAAFKQFFDVASPTGTMKAITLVSTCTTNTDMRGTDNAFLAATWTAFVAGITTLASWLGALMGKTADAGTLAEIQATTAGAGYDNTTDSLQAVRDTAPMGTAMRGTDNAFLAATWTSVMSGITSLAQWLGLIAGKQAGNATARTELRATGAGSGTFDETTDSLEALRDKATDIETDTAVIGALGAGLTGIPWNSAWDAEVQSEVEDALAAHIIDATGATVSLDQAVKELRAIMAGDYTQTGSGPFVFVFKAKDGTTTVRTWTIATDYTTRTVT